MFNEVLLLGRLAADAYINNNVVKVTVATKTGYDKEKDEDRTAFVPVTLFGVSDGQSALLIKGKIVLVRAIVRQSSYHKKDKDIDEKVYTTEVVANQSGLTFVA